MRAVVTLSAKTGTMQSLSSLEHACILIHTSHGVLKNTAPTWPPTLAELPLSLWAEMQWLLLFGDFHRAYPLPSAAPRPATKPTHPSWAICRSRPHAQQCTFKKVQDASSQPRSLSTDFAIWAQASIAYMAMRDLDCSALPCSTVHSNSAASTATHQTAEYRLVTRATPLLVAAACQPSQAPSSRLGSEVHFAHESMRSVPPAAF